MYWIFSGVIVLMLLILWAARFPKVERTGDEQAGAAAMYGYLLKKPIVLLFFVSVLLYVGLEQGTADWMSQFLSQYHGYDPHTVGANAVAWFWGLLTAGCGLGMLLLKLFDSRKVLLAFSLGALGSLTVALFGSGAAARLAFPGRRPVCLRDVAHHYLSGPEFGCGVPWSACRNSLLGHYGRSGRPINHRASGRCVWAPRGNDVPVLEPGLDSVRRVLGQAFDWKRNRSGQEAKVRGVKSSVASQSQGLRLSTLNLLRRNTFL